MLTLRTPSVFCWSRVAWVGIGAAVACAAVFFVVVGTPTARAQTRNTDRPDFQITASSFDGVNLHVEYINATGVYDRRRYEIAFQWYDASGTALGTRRWLPQPEVDRGGVGIFDTKYRTELSYRRSDRKIYGEQLTDYVRRRPDTGAELRITIDDGDRIPETNEQNNVASFTLPPLPQPDLTIRDAALTADALTFTYRNIGQGATPSGKPISLWFEWVDASGARVGSLAWSDRPTPLAPDQFAHLDAAGIQFSRERTGGVQTIGFRDLLGAVPENATHLKVIVDGPNAMVESDEANNVILLPRPSAPLPDLAFTNVFIVPNTEKLLVGFQNAGKAATPEFPWMMTWVDAAGTRVGVPYQGIGVALTPSWRFGVTSDMGDPKGKPMPIGKWLAEQKPDGAVRLEIVIDPENRIVESDETNNRRTFDGWSPPKPVPPPPPKLPDLTITDATLDTAALRFWYHNRGESPAAPTISLWYEWVDANGARVGELRWINVSAMAPTSKREGNQLLDFTTLDSERGMITLGAFIASAPASATHLKIAIDGPNAHRESDEQNNVVLLSKPVVPKPDLRIADLTVDPAAPRAGERVWFTARVENGGNATTGRPTATGITLNNDTTNRSIIGQFTTESIPAGKSATVRWTKENYYGWVAVEGTHTIDVCADRAAVVAEADETNNCARKEIIVSAPKEESKKPADITFGAVVVRDGALVIPIKNFGGIPSVATDIWLQWYGKGAWLPGSGAVDVPEIAAGVAVDVLVPLDRSFGPDGKLLTDIPSGAEHLRLFLDGSRKVEESNEQNNTFLAVRAKFSVVPPKPTELPDLTFVSVAQSASGDLVVQTINRGRGKTGAFVWDLQWEDADGKLLGTALHEKGYTMDPGFGYNVSIAARDTGRGSRFDPFFGAPPAGAVRVRVTLDSVGAMVESDETNNSATWTPRLPDLTFTGIDDRTNDVIIVKMINRGTGKAELFSWDLQWEDANGSPIGALLRESGITMVPGYGYNVTIDAKNTRRGSRFDPFFGAPPKGAARVRFTIDSAGTIAESDETNNIVRWTPAAILQKENAPPVARAGKDVTMLDGNGDGDETLTLVGESSSDPDGTIATWTWREGEKILSKRSRFDFRATVGAHEITLTVTDNLGASASDTVVITTNAKPVPEKPATADLVVTRVAVTRGTGTLWSVRATVVNRGGAAAAATTAWFTPDFDADDVPDAFPTTAEVVALTPGASADVVWSDTMEFPAGTHVVEVCADTEIDVAESDEENNCASTRVTASSAQQPTRGRNAFARITESFATMIGTLLGATPIRAGDSTTTESFFVGE